jgi:hypothetical protein
VHQRFTTPLAREVDCAATPGGCEIIVSWGFFGPPDRRASVPVSFAEAPPPTSTTIPTTTTVQRPFAPLAPPAVPVRAQPRFTG